MSSRWTRRLQVAAVCVLGIGYLGLAHYSNTRAHDPNLGAVLALAPELALGFLLMWRWGSPLLAVPLGAAALLTLRYFWPVFEHHFTWVYFLQDAALDGILTLSFAESLRVGRTPLCTRLADKVHGPLSHAELIYTRQVTLGWALFFSTLLAITTTLFFTAPLWIWSIFVNLCAFPLIGMMFVAENLLRRRVLPRGNRPGILGTMRVYLSNP